MKNVLFVLFQFESTPTYDQKISNKYVRRKMPLIEASEAIRILADTDDVIEDSDDQEDISALVKIISKSMLRVSSQIVEN